MMLTIALPPDVEAQLRQTAARRDPGALRWILADAIAPAVEAMLRETAAPEPADSEPASDGFEALLDRLADEFEAVAGPDVPPLPDDAVSRAGIYRDHP